MAAEVEGMSPGSERSRTAGIADRYRAGISWRNLLRDQFGPRQGPMRRDAGVVGLGRAVYPA